VAKVLRVGLSPFTSGRKQAELERIFGEAVEVVSVASPNLALIVERATTNHVDAVVFDAGSDVAAGVHEALPQMPLLQSRWRQREEEREYRNERGQLTRVTETTPEFDSYVRWRETGEPARLDDGEL
jgi:hypothetical protein